MYIPVPYQNSTNVIYNDVICNFVQAHTAYRGSSDRLHDLVNSQQRFPVPICVLSFVVVDAGTDGIVSYPRDLFIIM